MRTLGGFAAVMVLTLGAAEMVQAEEIKLIAAGSLKTALGEVAKTYSAQSGIEVATTFGPSGLMRKKIEAGEPHDVFASANMKHPATLMKDGRAGPVALFARNKLCGLAQADVAVASDSLLETLLDPQIRVGTSTPKADPSGDYAFELFDKAEAISPGARDTLKQKALQLTGGETSEKAPAGRNQYAWVMENDWADIFLTYCTNAVLAKREVGDLRIVAIPAQLAVGADYGLTVLKGASSEAAQLAMYILSPEAQAILAGYGFEATARPEK